MRAVERPAPVVVAVDGTDRSDGAVRYAVLEARRRGTGLSVVHVAPTALPVGGSMPYLDFRGDALTEVARRVADEAVTRIRTLAPDLTVEGVLRQGRRVEELAGTAATGSLLVLGRETRHGADRVYVGTTTAAVAARAPVPVAAVGSDWQATEHGRVVVGVEPRSGEVLSYAFPLAAARHATLQVLHAWTVRDPYADLDPERTGDWVVAATRLLESTVADWSAGFPDVTVEVAVVHGRPAQVLVDASASADVVLVARRRRSLGHPSRLGATARAVLGHAAAPVEVVPLTGVPQHAPLVLERFGEVLRS
ncbi:universal stress protein [Isoptericola dokdonensis]|uniref:Universal stress protein n=1 Tax=Isoptericola dokdonensis DS-3 TaxID=1300344 RepID=A0A168ECV1_9MICO|nr:universal stress protein [Isoptericola dokdonensis]ANC29892.1 Universal stress protein [Isoptericola dokdonensis DS-3]